MTLSSLHRYYHHRHDSAAVADTTAGRYRYHYRCHWHCLIRRHHTLTPASGEMACVMPALPPPPPSSHPQPSPPPPSPPPPSPPPPPSHLDCAGPVAPLEIAPLVTPVGYEVIPLLRGGKKKRRIGARNFTYVCVHDLDKYTCSECHGSGLCEVQPLMLATPVNRHHNDPACRPLPT